MKRLRSALLLPVLAAGLSSCWHDYDTERFDVKRGEYVRGYRVENVKRDGVSLSRVHQKRKYTTFYSKEGRPHMGGSHSLGNNESMKVLWTDPAAHRAGLEFSWLDSVGPLTMPPF